MVLLASVMFLLGTLPARAGVESAPAPALPDGPAAAQNSPQAKAAVAQFMQRPSVFIENDGQWADPQIRFALDGVGANVGLTESGPKFQLFRKTSPAVTAVADPAGARRDAPAPSEMHAFGLLFDGAAAATPVGRGRSESTFNYTVGAPENQRAGVPSFNAVWYENIYPGVSVELTGRRSGVKYNFHVAPGADWKSIRLRYENISGLSLGGGGALEIRVKDGWDALTDGAPYVYQEVNGAKKTVECAFRLIDERSYGFEVTGAYDATLPLVIDPSLAWSTYLGGTGDDYGRGVALDGSGNVYVAGYTNSSGWVSGGWNTVLGGGSGGGGGYDGYVVKLNAAGAHVWSTYLGGTGDDIGYGIALDVVGNIFVAGATNSPGWVSGQFNGGTGSGLSDGFLVKLGPTGTLLWGYYLGGADIDSCQAVAVDYSGNAFVTCATTHYVPPPLISTATIYSLKKVSSAGAQGWSWSTPSGTPSINGPITAVAVDGSGNIYATGSTAYAGWTSGGWNTTYSGSGDGFVVKLSTAGAPVWSTYLSGSGGTGIAADSNNNVFVTGSTNSKGWVSGGAHTTLAGGQDSFLVKLSGAGAHLWSTYLGGTNDDSAQAVAVDTGGNAYVTGYSNSTDWFGGGWSVSPGGGNDAFVAKFSGAGAQLWASCLGGTVEDDGYGIAVDGTDNLYVTGNTESSGWTGGGWNTSYGGGTNDAFVAKIYQGSEPVGSLRVTITPAAAAAAGAQWRRVGTAAWHNSGVVESGILPGAWEVEFKDLTGWVPAERHAVAVPSGATLQDAGTYVAVSVDMTWSTYLGGIRDDYGRAIAVDGSGNVYVTGETYSSGWVSGGWNTVLGGGSGGGGPYDGYVVKLNAAGAHVWSTYLGGSGNDFGRGVAVDGSGNVYVTGDTTTSGWVSGGWHSTLSGTSDAFVVKLNAMGAPLWSTYLGGSSAEYGYAIAVDSSGNSYTTGSSYSAGWVSGGWHTTLSGPTDAFVVKLSSAGAHVWSTYLGGTADDTGYGIALDGSGNAYVTGETKSTGWVSGGWKTTYGGGYADAFVVKLNASGTHAWSTYLGGTLADTGYGIAVDASGEAYATGITASPSWVSGGGQTTLSGTEDAYVVKLNAAGAHLWSTFLGGTDDDYGRGIAVDGSGNAYVTGGTFSPGWVGGGWNASFGGFDDAYVVKLNGGGVHQWSTYLGGAGDDYGAGIAVDGTGKIYVTGTTTSAGWVSGGWNTSRGGGTDAFAVKIADAGQTGNLQVTITPPEAVTAGAQWRRKGTLVWQASGATETGIGAGYWQVEFNHLPGWAPLESHSVAVPPNGTAQDTVVYSRVAADLNWSTYVGGSGDDSGQGIAVDGSGNVYATGYTASSGWVSGAWQSVEGGGNDAYVVKLSPAGAHLWSTYLGGAGDDYGYGIAADTTGNVYVTGSTASSGWTSGGWDTSFGGTVDGFVVKLSAAGAHVWSTYVGGGNSEEGHGIAVDGGGNVYVTGFTNSAGWVSGGWNVVIGGYQEGFAVKLSPAGVHLWSTYLAPGGYSDGHGIAVDGSANVYVTGTTDSTGWVSGGFNTTFGGGKDA